MSREPLETMPDVMDAKQLADWRTEAGDETRFVGMVAEPYQRKGIKSRSRVGKNGNLPIAGAETYNCIVQANSIGKLPHFPGS